MQIIKREFKDMGIDWAKEMREEDQGFGEYMRGRWKHLPLSVSGTEI
jgi:hypothetical protein